MNEFHCRVSQLYAKFCKSVKPNIPDITHRSLKVDGDMSGLRKYISSAYFPETLFEEIEKYTYKGIKVDYIIHDVNVQCEIFYLPKTTSRQDLRILFEILSFMVFYCRMLSTHPMQCMNINLILSPIKKRANTVTLDAYHVNSGYTTLHEPQGTASVIIYRKEEVIKVLIHELLHSFAMDVKHYTSDDIILKQMGFKFQVKSPRGVRLNEALTDAYACVLNVCIASIVYKKDFKFFRRLMEKERKYICRRGWQVAMMLGILRKNTHIYVETTHVMSYYVIKSLVFHHLDDFIADLFRNRFHLTLESLRLVKASELESFTFHSKSTLGIMPKSIRMSSVDILASNSKILKTT
jgi:hypothetical protein